MARSPETVDGTVGLLRVLIVEDSMSDTELMVRELRSFGYEPQWTRVETEEDFRKNIDSGLQLILADYTLPQFDAPGALRIMQERGFSIPFIVVTGTITEETAVAALKQGADDYLLKDRLGRLGPAVKSALEQGRLRNERKRLAEEKAADVVRLAELSRRVVAVQEEERRRLAAELHDNTSPSLAAVSLNLGLIAADLPPQASNALASRIADARGLLAGAIAAIRDVCADLRPATLDYVGLNQALQEYAGQFSRRTGIAVHVSGMDSRQRLAAEKETMLFRVAQEALTNCAKHAKATSISVDMTHASEQVVLTISDNGAGFDPEALGQSESRPGLGLLTMRERAEFAGAKFSLESQPGKGTRIRVEI